MAREMTKNYYFRKFQCGLSKKDTAKLCFKSVRTVTRWDSGQPIPPECRRLMKLYKGHEIVSLSDNWEGWKFNHGELVMEGGIRITPQQILTGYALIQLGANKEREHIKQILKIARILKRY
ncbi:hypothetical protein [Photobacterium leiognathi]|uniref:hypothetical protein n=1 Tax=Photobacterium leiognathi TaxID=553611 RepID=UPI002981E46A|nr:hypothetical protein [Photobacterium leiognathi]